MSEKKSGCFGCLLKMGLIGAVFIILALLITPKRQPNEVSETVPVSAEEARIEASLEEQKKFLKEATAEEIVIPGLMPEEVHGLVTPKGFTLKTRSGELQHEWLCSKEPDHCSLSVDCFGKNATDIFAVSAMAAGPEASANETKTDAVELLPLVATIAYDKAEPDQASKWVREHLGENTEKAFGPCTFKLISVRPGAFVLDIRATTP